MFMSLHQNAEKCHNIKRAVNMSFENVANFKQFRRLKYLNDIHDEFKSR
jgi:hypothetical protein